MSFLIYPHKFDACHLHFGTAVQNNDSDSKFARIIYSTKYISFNGVGIGLNFTGAKHEHHFNKIFVSFDASIHANQALISRIRAIECEIINKYVGSVLEGPRRCIYSLTEQLNSECVKAYVNDNYGSGVSNDDSTANVILNTNGSQIMIKISGVWETDDECGITYKFVKC